MNAFFVVIILVSLNAVYGGYLGGDDLGWESASTLESTSPSTRQTISNQGEPSSLDLRVYFRKQDAQANREAMNNYRILDKLDTLETYMRQLRERDQYGYQYNCNDWGVWQLINQSYATLAVTGTTLLLILLFFLVKLIQCCRKRKRPSEPCSNVPTSGCFIGPCPSCAVSINCGPRAVDVEPRAERVAATRDRHKASAGPRG